VRCRVLAQHAQESFLMPGFYFCVSAPVCRGSEILHEEPNLLEVDAPITGWYQTAEEHSSELG
jgi:hypothetical protein